MLKQADCWYSLAARGTMVVALVLLPDVVRAEYQGKVQILLFGRQRDRGKHPAQDRAP